MLVQIKKGDAVKTIVTENGGYLQTGKNMSGLPLPTSGYSQLNDDDSFVPVAPVYVVVVEAEHDQTREVNGALGFLIGSDGTFYEAIVPGV